MRCAIVASGTWKASPTSGVGWRPPGRRVGATGGAGGREVAGAAAERAEQRVVALGLRGGGPRLGLDHVLASLPRGLAAAGVDEPPQRNGRQPRTRVLRWVRGPGPQRLEQRFLQRVL